MSHPFTSGAGFITNLLLALAVSCSSPARTKYKSFEKNHGYRELPTENGLRVVSFAANSHTPKFDAELFAKFRSVEVCTEAGLKLAHMLDVKDRSVSKDVLRTSGTGFPSYYYGMSPYYNRFSGIGLGISTSSSNTWEETYTYPDFAVYFECVDSAFGPELLLRDVSAEDMKLLVKDLKGGIQVEKVMEGSPNAEAIREGDVILRARGLRIQHAYQLLAAFSRERRQVPVEIMREGVRKSVTLKSSDVTQFISKSQKDIVELACTKKEIRKRPICGGEGGKS